MGSERCDWPWVRSAWPRQRTVRSGRPAGGKLEYDPNDNVGRNINLSSILPSNNTTGGNAMATLNRGTTAPSSSGSPSDPTPAPAAGSPGANGLGSKVTYPTASSAGSSARDASQS